SFCTVCHRSSAPAHRAARAAPAASEAMKDFVAATLASSPAERGRQMSALAAAGEGSALTRGTVRAPPAGGACSGGTMSGLWPDCEMTTHTEFLSFRRDR